jgi:hypothetical protein
MRKVSVEYQYTLAEAITAVVEVTKCVSKGSVFLPWLGAALLLLCIVNVKGFGLPVSNLGFPFFFGVFFAATPLTVRWSAKRSARQLPSLNKMVGWHITDFELQTSTVGEDTRFVWEKIIKIQERKNGFLLFPQPRLAHWIPKHGFKSENDIQLFREIAKSKSIEFKGWQEHRVVEFSPRRFT